LGGAAPIVVNGKLNMNSGVVKNKSGQSVTAVGKFYQCDDAIFEAFAK